MTYKVQIDDLVRDATPEEIAIIEKRNAEHAARNLAVEAQIAARNSAIEKLAALGLTDAEIAALVG